MEEGTNDCEFCYGVRGAEGIDEKVSYHMNSLTTGKLRVDDYEHLVNAGFARFGTWLYNYNVHSSCCDVFPYRIDITQFTPNSQQRKAIKRFYRYLLLGKDHGVGAVEEEK